MGGAGAHRRVEIDDEARPIVLRRAHAKQSQTDSPVDWLLLALMLLSAIL